jgi:hypothetical protein
MPVAGGVVSGRPIPKLVAPMWFWLLIPNRATGVLLLLANRLLDRAKFSNRER